MVITLLIFFCNFDLKKKTPKKVIGGDGGNDWGGEKLIKMSNYYLIIFKKNH